MDYAPGQGRGNPVQARAILAGMGKLGFELSYYYYSSDSPSSAAANQVRTQALTRAGFTVGAIGLAHTQARTMIADPDAPVNTGQPVRMCYDWPAGDLVSPITFGRVLAGESVGFASDTRVDSEVTRAAELKIEQQDEWARFNNFVMSPILRSMPTTHPRQDYLFGSRVHHVVNDLNLGHAGHFRYLGQPPAAARHHLAVVFGSGPDQHLS